MLKCTGSNPCQRCINKNQECEFDTGKDQRTQRKELKRKLDDIEQESATLRGIIESLRKCSEADIPAIVQIIRNGSTYDDIRISLRQYSSAEALVQGRERGLMLDKFNSRVWTAIQESTPKVSPTDLQDGHRHKRVLKVTQLVDNSPT